MLRGPTQPLPHRAELERRFGRKLGHLRVHSHARARSLLDQLGARGAVRDRQILLRDAADLPTLIHEVAHALQPRAAGSGRVRAGVQLASTAAEDEADRATREVLLDGCLRTPLRAGLADGVFALRERVVPPELAEKPKLLVRKPRVPKETRDKAAEKRKKTLRAKVEAAIPKHKPKPKVEKKAEAKAEAKPEVEADAEATPTEAQQTEDEAAKQQQGEQRRGGLPPSTVNRAKDLRKLAQTSQTSWSNGAKTADDYEVDPASDAAVGAEHHPFVRGPPFVPPELVEGEMPSENPTREAVPGEDHEAAEGNVFATLAQTARKKRLEKYNDETYAAERAAKAKEVDDAIETEFAKYGFETLTADKIELEGEDEATRTKNARDSISTELKENQTLEHQRSNEDYGEKVLGPKADPTAGHDVMLDALEIPSIDVIARAPEELLAKVATDDNVGKVPIDELLLVEDESFDAAAATKPLHDEARAKIDERLHEGTNHLQTLEKRAVAERDQQFRTAETGITELRGKWRGELDKHVETRRGEAETFVKDKVEHADGLRKEAEKAAKDTVDDANADAESRWDEAQEKAQKKSEESEDKSWWEKGLDYVADAIAALTEWIADFIRVCKDAIDQLLDAAKSLAHDIIIAGRDAVAATFDMLRSGLDFMADNLPGELGEIAKGWRDSAYEYLDEAQAKVDGWADDLHNAVDDGINAVKEAVDTTLGGLADAVENTGKMIADLLTMGLMPWLHKYFPEVAQLVEDGLIAPVKWAAGTLNDWIETVLESTGIGKIMRALEGVEEDDDLCMGKTKEEQEQDCKAFERLLQGALDRFDRLLKHPIAQKIKAYLQKQQDEQAQQQVDSVSNFFDFIGAIAKPIAKWWDKITSAIGDIVDVLKKVAGTIWRQLASALGIDPNIDPIEAIKEGIQALWETAVEAVQGVVDAIREGWTWLKEKSPLAGIIDFIGRLPELWTELSNLWEKIKSGVGDWLASAAEWLRDTFIPPIEAMLGAASEALHAVLDTLGSFAEGFLAVLDSLLAWKSTWEVINFLADLLKTLIKPIRLVVKLFCDCVLKALRWIADAIKNLLHYLRVFLDITIGIITAMLLGPIGIAAFLAGATWLYLVPECYKGPILNFLLDVAIKFIEFFPEPADFVLAAIYQGALSFLRTLRKAPDETKVKAVDLVASIFAGNVEVAAGIAVGLVGGVWESTGGTIIFLLEIVAWLISLPFKLISWAADIISGKSSETDPEADAGPVEPGAAEPAAGEAEVEELVEVEHPARGPPAEQVVTEPEPTADVEEADAEPSAEAEKVESTEEQEVPESAQLDTDADPQASTTEPEKPPASPEELPQLTDILSKIVNEGFSKQEIRDLIDSLRAQLKMFVGKLAEEAAKSLLDSLTAKGSAYQIGKVIGFVLGMIVVEVVLAYFTAGASVLLTTAKTALSGVKLAGRIGQAFMKIKKAIEPLLKMLSKLKKTVQALIGRVQKWLDDVLAWIKGIFKRKPKARGPPKVPGKKPGKQPAKQKGKPKEEGKPKDKKKDKDKDKDKDKKDQLRLVAERAARAGWTRAKARAARKVILESEMRTVLKGTKVKHKPDVRVHVDIDHEGTHKWRVAATASKGVKQATAHSSRGWLGHDESKRRWCAAATDQEKRHERAVRNVDERIEAEAQKLAEKDPKPQTIHSKLQPKIRKIEKSPHPRLLDGVSMEIEEARFKQGKDEKNRPALLYDYRIGPNMIRGNLWITMTSRVSLLPTYNLAHPWLRTATPSITALGPFKFHPRTIAEKANASKPVNGGFFKFEPRTRMALLSDGLWTACNPAHQYDQEWYEWVGDADGGQLQRNSNANRLMGKQRDRANAAQMILHNRGTTPLSNTQKRMLERLHGSPNGGLTARPFTSLADEDTAIPAMLTLAPKGVPHARERHVLVGGGINNEMTLAMRAGFHLIPGLAGLGPGLGTNGAATAWQAERKANAVARKLLNQHFLNKKQWQRARRDLALDIWGDAGRSETTQANPNPGSIIVAQKHDTPRDAAYADSELPAHHATVIAALYPGTAAATGPRKLVASDSGGSLPALVEMNPSGITPTSVIVRIVTGPQTRGWVLNTMYPV